MPRECILSDDEYYDLFKSLHTCIEIYPDFLAKHAGLLTRLATLYRYRETQDEGKVEFIVTIRSQEGSEP